ncbi:MAG: hypothetical protein WDO56_16300 [Gammaproteobacteria bacterium]
MGKRIALQFENGYWLVIHLMIAGRLHWFATGSKKSGRAVLAAFVFDTGTLTLTEAGHEAPGLSLRVSQRERSCEARSRRPRSSRHAFR